MEYSWILSMRKSYSAIWGTQLHLEMHRRYVDRWVEILFEIKNGYASHKNVCFFLKYLLSYEDYFEFAAVYYS